MRLTTAVTGLSKSENADLEEACKKLETRVEDFRGKRTLFWNGENLWDGDDDGNPIVYNKDERRSWEVIIILPGVEVIPEGTFNWCRNVKRVIMADTVRRIEYKAFNYCMSLSYVKLSTNLEYIGRWAFYYCDSLTSIFIPPSCREIGDGAFDSCTKLLIFHVPQHTTLGISVIDETHLSQNCPFIDANGEYQNYEQVNDWIKNRHGNFPLHKLCCSENPKFDTNTLLQHSLTKDDCGCTPLMYLICNQTADFDMFFKMVKVGRQKLLTEKDSKGWNSLHYACWIGDVAVQKLLVKIGGRELAKTLKDNVIPPLKNGLFDKRSEDDNYFKIRDWSVIQQGLYIHDYVKDIKSNADKSVAEKLIADLLEMKPSYADIHEIIHNKTITIPTDHLNRFKEYNKALLDQELKVFQDTQEKVPLMRSTITVVGRGRDGKTSTINSLKGLPFQPYCESTKGSKTSEVDVHDIGIHVTNIEASDVAFEEAERDASSSDRSVASYLIKGNREREYIDTSKTTTEERASSTQNVSEGNSPPLKRQKVEQTDQVQVFRMQEEEDVAKKVDDIDLATSKDGKSIRFTIYDNGGQRVFRCIQNLLLSREGIFIVVFDIMKIFHESSRAEALEHLEYWLSSIKLDACKKNGQEDKNGDIDASIKYPPVILVGTHFDEFKELKGDITTGLKTLHDLLRETLPLTDLVPLSNSPGKSESNRLHLYNQEQDLCFWPVDNSNAEDENILKLRKLILDAAMNDEGFDISQEVPISMLRSMDKLTKISQKQPIIPVIDEKGNQVSVMKVMSDCGVFVNGNIQNENVCRDLLTKYHNLGHFIYFHQVEALRDYCILDPQWLIDMITYIVRDFRYHWFLRDTNAIEMNNGTSWNRLKDCGILDFPLLHQLWVGTSKAHIDFLSEVLLKIGIFGKSSDYFTVPIVQTITSEAAYIESKNKISETLEERILVGHIDLKKQRFVIVPFYCRLVNALVVKDGPTPTILFSACVLRHGENGQMFALLLDYSASKILIVSSHSELKEKVVVKHIRKISDELNTIFYGDHLEFEVIDDQDKGNESLRPQNQGEVRHIYRNEIQISSETQMQDVDDFEKKLGENLVLQAQYKDLLHFLKKKVNTEKAITLSKTMLKANEDVSISTLQSWYHNDTKSFMENLLPELGVGNIFDKSNVTAAIKELGQPPIPKSYMIACIDENEFSTEKELIRYKMSSSNYTAQFANLSDEEWESDILRCCENYNSTLLHFGAHKGSLEQANLQSVFSDKTIMDQTKCCVLNSCQSDDVIEIVTKALSQKCIIYWDSKVHNEAAIRFSMEFYGILFANIKNSFDFKRAFEKAKFLMEKHKFVFADPDKESCNTGQTIAGVLKMLPGNVFEENTSTTGQERDMAARRQDNDSNGSQGDVNMSAVATTSTVNAGGNGNINNVNASGHGTLTIESPNLVSQNPEASGDAQSAVSVPVATNGSVRQEQTTQRFVSHHTTDNDNTLSQSGTNEEESRWKDWGMKTLDKFLENENVKAVPANSAFPGNPTLVSNLDSVQQNLTSFQDVSAFREFVEVSFSSHQTVDNAWWMENLRKELYRPPERKPTKEDRGTKAGSVCQQYYCFSFNCTSTKESKKKCHFIKNSGEPDNTKVLGGNPAKPSTHCSVCKEKFCTKNRHNNESCFDVHICFDKDYQHKVKVEGKCHRKDCSCQNKSHAGNQSSDYNSVGTFPIGPDMPDSHINREIQATQINDDNSFGPVAPQLDALANGKDEDPVLPGINL